MGQQQGSIRRLQMRPQARLVPAPRPPSARVFAACSYCGLENKNGLHQCPGCGQPLIEDVSAFAPTFVCTGCGSLVSMRKLSGIGMLHIPSGIVSELCCALDDSISCPKCGRIPYRHLPPELQRSYRAFIVISATIILLWILFGVGYILWARNDH
jgi:hypothetical protein